MKETVNKGWVWEVGSPRGLWTESTERLILGKISTYESQMYGKDKQRDQLNKQLTFRE